MSYHYLQTPDSSTWEVEADKLRTAKDTQRDPVLKAPTPQKEKKKEYLVFYELKSCNVAQLFKPLYSKQLFYLTWIYRI